MTPDRDRSINSCEMSTSRLIRQEHVADQLSTAACHAGGKDVHRLSNVVFSSGGYDPWQLGTSRLALLTAVTAPRRVTCMWSSAACVNVKGKHFMHCHHVTTPTFDT